GGRAPFTGGFNSAARVKRTGHAPDQISDQPGPDRPAFLQNAFRNPDVGPRTLDDYTAPDGRARRGQCGDLGHAGPAVAGASGPGSSARIPGVAAPTSRIGRERAVGFDLELCGG